MPSYTDCPEQDGVIQVPPGTLCQISLGSGDVLSNTLIDITASGADVFITADGTDWTIRNVGIRGQIAARDDPPLAVVKDRGGTSRIENCYFGDGGAGSLHDKAGIFVHADHSGRLLVDRCYIANFKDAALYASPPGNPDTSYFAPNDIGQGGTVEVTNCYFENNMVSDVRLGTTGSLAQNVVAVGNDHRGFWSYYETQTFENCDAAGAGRSFEAGGNTHGKQGDAVMELVDCRADSRINPDGGADIVGTPGSNPRTTPPDGVPTSPQAAASGESNGGGNGGGQPDYDHDLVIGTVQGAPLVSYELLTENEPVPGPEAETPGTDTITQTNDGAWRVSGTVGNGAVDDFRFDGAALNFTADHPDSEWYLELDGTRVTVDELVTQTGGDTPVSPPDPPQQAGFGPAAAVFLGAAGAYLYAKTREDEQWSATQE